VLSGLHRHRGGLGAATSDRGSATPHLSPGPCACRSGADERDDLALGVLTPELPRRDVEPDEAEKAYREQADKHMAMFWAGSGEAIPHPS
jgi:hypothetical protein